MILNVEMFNFHMRQTKELTLTSAAIEAKVKTFTYEGQGRLKDERVEAGKLPPYALVFYSLVYQINDLPTPQELIDAYFNQDCFCHLPNQKVQVSYDGQTAIYDLEGMMGRIQRAYPSLVRDLHFYLMACESGLFDAVHYSFEKDYFKKIDIQIQFQGKWHNIGLLLESKRSIFYKFKKQFRHKPTEVIYIELDPAKSKRCGDFYLYNNSHIEELFNIVSNQKKHRR